MDFEFVEQMGSSVENVAIRIPLEAKEGDDSLKQSNEELKNHNLSEIEVAVVMRAQQNKCYEFFFELVMSVTFNFLIYCFILANTVTLALYRFDQSEEQTRVLALCDIIFVWVFTAEMLAKIVGHGFVNYCKDKFNVFDAVIVIIGLVDFVLSLTIDTQSGTTGAIMNACRALRLLRVVKLARHWKAF